jgi:hypothetical protein
MADTPLTVLTMTARAPDVPESIGGEITRPHCSADAERRPLIVAAVVCAESETMIRVPAATPVASTVTAIETVPPGETTEELAPLTLAGTAVPFCVTNASAAIRPALALAAVI